MSNPESMPGRCDAVVYKRDAFRYTGRSKNGFEMHYTKDQCSRRATCPDGFCKQHARGNPLRWSVRFGLPARAAENP